MRSILYQGRRKAPKHKEVVIMSEELALLLIESRYVYLTEEGRQLIEAMLNGKEVTNDVLPTNSTL